MRRRRLLAGLSAAQLTCGVAGLVIAVMRRHPYDILWFRGHPEDVARDALGMGTALSAPMPMLVSQGAMTVALLRVPERATQGQGLRAGLATSRVAESGLAVLGAAMVPGYLGERHVRHVLSRGGWDPVESPLAGVGLGLAAAMAVMGLWIRRTARAAQVIGPGAASPAPAP